MNHFFRRLIVCILLFPFIVEAQNYKAVVLSSAGQVLVGAKVFYKSGKHSSETNSEGEFFFSKEHQTDSVLIYLKEYAPLHAKLEPNNNLFFSLTREADELSAVEIRAYRPAGFISAKGISLTQVITAQELKKAACCDLSGCFETTIAVSPQVTNVITRSKELRILGLSGTNNQVLVDGFPMIYGLTFPYGVSTYPGTIIKNIFVSKGAGSVIQSFEGFTGQINMITQNGDNGEKLFVNAYANNFGEKQLNLHHGAQHKGHRFFTSFHAVTPATWMDGDDDDFGDMPLIKRYHLSHKWEFENPDSSRWTTRTGFRLLQEERTGGQMLYDPKKEKGSSTRYGQHVKYFQPEFFTRTAFRINEENELIFFSSLNIQNQNSWYGTLNYKAQQMLSWSQFQWDRKSGNHGSVIGASLRYFDIKEDISFSNSSVPRNYAGVFARVDRVAGLFTEQTISFPKYNTDVMIGARADHYVNHGSHFTPRLLIRSEIIEGWVLRLNTGTGWRIANPFSENIILLTGNRDVVLGENLLVEKAINHGASLTKELETMWMSGSVTLDYYHTRVKDQVFPDFDTDPGKALMFNYAGITYSNAAQIEGRFKLFDLFDLSLGYNYLDVYRKLGGVKTLLPFNTNHRAIAMVSIPFFEDRLKVDVNNHWYGKQRLPDTSKLPETYRQPNYSQNYYIISPQVTWIVGAWEFYLGCENITGFRQGRPILGWQDPFGKYFDPSFAWGPNRGQEIYGGLRWTLKSKES
jgi:outer membrane receptor for ferrienterochelin and colicins